MKSWHFVSDTLRDGQPIPADGEPLIHQGRVEICSSGLHASKRLIDALQYAPGHTLCRVNCSDIVETQNDKFVCRERTILWRIDGKEILCKFARMCVLDVAHLWDAPPVVVQFLKTGNEEIRIAAWTAARDAAWDAARAAARDAAWNAAWAAAKDAAKDAARATAWAAARNAAWDAARDKQNRRLVRLVNQVRGRLMNNQPERK